MAHVKGIAGERAFDDRKTVDANQVQGSSGSVIIPGFEGMHEENFLGKSDDEIPMKKGRIFTPALRCLPHSISPLYACGTHAGVI